jgi:hypothetical protein
MRDAVMLDISAPDETLDIKTLPPASRISMVTDEPDGVSVLYVIVFQRQRYAGDMTGVVVVPTQLSSLPTVAVGSGEAYLANLNSIKPKKDGLCCSSIKL